MEKENPIVTAPKIDPRWLRQRYLVDRLPVATIAEQAGVSVDVVYRACRGAGFPHRGKGGAHPPIELDPRWLQQQIEAGFSPGAIARDSDVDRSTVVWALARHQLLDVSAEPRAAQAAKLYAAGASLAAVADRLGVGRRRVTEWLMAQGVPLRAVGRPGR